MRGLVTEAHIGQREIANETKIVGLFFEKGFHFAARLLLSLLLPKEKVAQTCKKSARSRKKLGRNSRFRALRQRGIEVKGYREPRRSSE